MKKTHKKNRVGVAVPALFAALIFLLSSGAAKAATYYVDSSRPDDSGNGLSQGAAWKTIDKVNKSSFQPGDNILFKRGQSWHEQLTVPSSGTNGNPITFGAYGTGANPKIYRTDTYSAWWEHSLMANGGMEFITPGSSDDQWSKQTEGSGTSIAGDTTVKNSGNSSVKLTSTGNGQAFSGTNYVDLIKYATVTANTDYYFRVSGRVGVVGNNALLLRIRDTGSTPNKYLDANGNWQESNTTVAMSWNGTTPNTWVQKTISFKPGSTSLDFEFYNFQTGSAWIDDAYFMQGTGPSATRIWAGTINLNSNYDGAVLNGKRVVSYLSYCKDPTGDPDPLYCAHHGYDSSNNYRIAPFQMVSGYFNGPLNTDYFFYRSDLGPPPTMEVGARLNAILIKNKSHIVIDSIDVEGPGGNVYPGETSCGDDDSATCSRMLVHIGNHADNITIKNAEVANSSSVGIWSGSTTTNIYYDNLNVHDNQSTGIYMNGQGGGVTNSKSHDNGRRIGDGGDMGGIGSYQGGNLLISGNEVYHNAPDDQTADFEISVVAPTNPFNITKNYVHDCIQGCIQIANGGDNSTISYNIINKYGTSTATDYGVGSHSGINLGGGAGPGVLGAKILNNVIAGGMKSEVNNTPPYNWPTEAAINASYDCSNLVVKNNIFYNNANRDIHFHNGSTTNNMVFDNNIYYRTSYIDNWWIRGYPENSFASWQSAYSQDAHSSTSNPLFTNASGNFSQASDFQLQSNSPAKDAGANVSLTTDYAGTAVPQNSTPDIGAYEYSITYSAADINRDESINLTDFNILKFDFLKIAASLANPRSDIDGDGQVTIKDVGILMSGWK